MSTVKAWRAGMSTALSRAQQKRQHIDVPDLDDAGPGEHRQDNCLDRA